MANFTNKMDVPQGELQSKVYDVLNSASDSGINLNTHYTIEKKDVCSDVSVKDGAIEEVSTMLAMMEADAGIDNLDQEDLDKMDQETERNAIDKEFDDVGEEDIEQLDDSIPENSPTTSIDTVDSDGDVDSEVSVISTEPESDLDTEDLDGGSITVELPDDVDPRDLKISIDGEEYEYDDGDISSSEDGEVNSILVDVPDGVDPTDITVNVNGSEYVIAPEEAENLETTSEKEVVDDEEIDSDIDNLSKEDLKDMKVQTENSKLELEDSGLEDSELDDSEDEDMEEEDLDDEDDSDDEDTYSDEEEDEESDSEDEEEDEVEVEDEDMEEDDTSIEESLKIMNNKLAYSYGGQWKFYENDNDLDLTIDMNNDQAEDLLPDIHDALSGDGTISDTGIGAATDSLSMEINSETVSSNGNNIEDMQGEELVDTSIGDDKVYATENYYIKGLSRATNKKLKRISNILEGTGNRSVQNKALKIINESFAPASKKISKLIDKYVGKTKLKESTLNKVSRMLSEMDANIAHTNYPEIDKSELSYSASSSWVNSDGNLKTTYPTMNQAEVFSSNVIPSKRVMTNLRNGIGSDKPHINSKGNYLASEGYRFNVDDSYRMIKPLDEVSVTTTSLPLARNASWNNKNASGTLIETAYRNEAKVNYKLLKATHLYYINEGKSSSDYMFPIGTIINNKVYAIPKAIEEATALFASPMYTKKFSESALRKIRGVLDHYLGKMGKRSPWSEGKCVDVSTIGKCVNISRVSYNPLKIAEMELKKQEKDKAMKILRG